MALNKKRTTKVSPQSTLGKNGDFKIGSSSGGVKLFAKYNNHWYSTPLSIKEGGTVLQEAIRVTPSRNVRVLNDLSITNDSTVGNDLTVENDITMNGDVFQMGSGHNFIYGNTTTDYDITMKTYGQINLIPTSQRKVDILTSDDSGSGEATLRHSFNGSSHFIFSGADDSDWCKISVAAEGATTIQTKDSAAATAHFTLDVDGDVILDPNSGITKFYLAGDSDDLCTLTVTANGATTLATADSDGTAGHLTLDVDGDIELNADNGNVSIKDDSAIHFLFDCNGTRFRIYDDTSDSDHFTIQVAANGASTLTTVDNDGTAGHLTLDVNGDIILDSDTGEFIAKKAGTEFSAANSAYAGMILAYTVIGESTTHTTYAMTTSLAVPDADMNVSFVAPPSGNVEIMAQFHRDSVASNKFVYVSLSDNATFNALGHSYTQISTGTDETDDLVCQHYWTITGLTAGSSYQYWFGIRTNGTTTNMKWGGTAGNRFCDFIMKTTALPATLGGE